MEEDTKTQHPTHRNNTILQTHIRRKNKTNERRGKKKVIRNESKKGPGRKDIKTCSNVQCPECGRWYFDKIIAIHISQCRVLKEFTIDINRNERTKGLTDNKTRTFRNMKQEPLPPSFLKNSRIKVKHSLSTEIPLMQNYRNRREESNRKSEVEEYEQAYVSFEKMVSSADAILPLTMDQIPFPSNDLLNKISNTEMLHDASSDMRRVFRETLVRWHPDLFFQKFRPYIAPRDIPQIQARLNEVVRSIASLKSNLERR